MDTMGRYLRSYAFLCIFNKIRLLGLGLEIDGGLSVGLDLVLGLVFLFKGENPERRKFVSGDLSYNPTFTEIDSKEHCHMNKVSK